MAGQAAEVGYAEERTINGVTATYHYPPATLQLDSAQLKAMCELSAAHAVGDMTQLDFDPEQHPAQGAYCVESPAPDADTMIGLGNFIMPGDDKNKYGKFITDTIEQHGDQLDEIGRKLEAGMNVAHAIFHGPLLDDGLAHGAMTVSLKVMGYDFKTAIIVSGGTSGLGIALAGATMPVPAALKTGTDKVWQTIPRTENARNSDFGKQASRLQIARLNKLMLDGFAADLEEGGWLFTILPDASTHRRGPDGEYQLLNPSNGTLDMMAGPKDAHNTYVQAAGGRFLGREEPLYGLFGGLRELSDNKAVRRLQGDAMMLDMAAGATALIPDETFAADLPKDADLAAISGFRQLP